MPIHETMNQPGFFFTVHPSLKMESDVEIKATKAISAVIRIIPALASGDKERIDKVMNFINTMLVLVFIKNKRYFLHENVRNREKGYLLYHIENKPATTLVRTTLYAKVLHMFQKFILKKLIGNKLKAAGMSDAQIEQLLDVINKNPEFFKKIQDQVEAKKKQGISEQAAMMTVMRENQGELQKILAGIAK